MIRRWRITERSAAVAAQLAAIYGASEVTVRGSAFEVRYSTGEVYRVSVLQDCWAGGFRVKTAEDRLRLLSPRCGWVSGYNDCERDGCEFPAERCAEISDARKAERWTMESESQVSGGGSALLTQSAAPGESFTPPDDLGPGDERG